MIKEIDKIEFDDFIEFSNKENGLIYYAKYNYGEYYQLAYDAISLTKCIKNIDSKCYIFVHFYNHTIYCLKLSIISSLRKHKVQAHMILRQALESSVLAVYSIYNNKLDDFGKIEHINGIDFLKPVDEVKGKANKWLNDKYNTYSNYIKKIKNNINDVVAHANIVITESNIKINSENNRYKLLQFDSEHPEYKYVELFAISDIIYNILVMFFTVNNDYQLITFIEDFENNIFDFKVKLDSILLKLIENPNIKEQLNYVRNI